MAAKRAQLIAEAVSVVCPHCGSCQPNQDGSEMWMAEDFNKKSGMFTCVSCDAMLHIFHDPKAQFPKAMKLAKS